MAKTNSLVASLTKDFTHITFVADTDFFWSPLEKAVHYGPLASDRDHLTLLHEISHAHLKHQAYRRDIDLVKMEREAWEYVREVLGPRYRHDVDDDTIEEAIDTYREWLHARSRCPQCSQTGIQSDASSYHCLACGSDWRVNEARRCGLKRYSTTN